jgi:hypothetical protein
VWDWFLSLRFEFPRASALGAPTMVDLVGRQKSMDLKHAPKIGGGSEKTRSAAERQWVGPPRAKEIRAAPANCFNCPAPKSTALQSDLTVISKKADGCIDTHHKIGLLRSRICQLLNRPQSRSRVERAPDRYPDRCPDNLLSHCPATRTSFRAASHGIDAACECSLTTRLRRAPQCRLRPA